MSKGNPRTRLDRLEESISTIAEAVNGQPGAILDALTRHIDDKMDGVYKEAYSSAESTYLKAIEEKDQENERLKSELQAQNERIGSLENSLQSLPTEEYINSKLDALNSANKKAAVRMYRKALRGVEERTENALNSLSHEIDSKFQAQEDLLHVAIAKLETLDALIEKGEKLGERFSGLFSQVYKRESRRENKTKAYLEQLEEMNAEMANSVDMITSTSESAAETKESVQVLTNEFRELAAEAEQTKDHVREMLSGAERKIINQWVESQREINNTSTVMVSLIKDHLDGYSQKHEHSLSRVDGGISSLKSLVHGVQKTQNNIDDSTVTLTTSVEGLRGDMTDLKQLKTVPYRLDNIENSIEQVADTFQLVMQSDEEASDE